MTPHYIPVGTSEPQDFAIKNAGAALDGSGGVTLALVMTKNGEPVSPAPSITWLSPEAGTVRVTGTENLTAGTYVVRFKLTDSGGKVGFAPNGASGMIWVVDPVP